jgi:hypothetical protein
MIIFMGAQREMRQVFIKTLKVVLFYHCSIAHLSRIELIGVSLVNCDMFDILYNTLNVIYTRLYHIFLI